VIKIKKLIAILILTVLLFALFAVPVLAAVSMPTAVRNDDGSVTLTWTGGEENEKLTIQRTDKGETNYESIAKVPQTDGTYTDKDADPHTPYYYRFYYGADSFTKSVAVPNDIGLLPPKPPKISTGGLFEQAIAGVVNGLCLMFESAVGTVGFHRLNEVIFPNKEFSMDLETPAPFTKEWNNLDKMYLAFAIGTLPLCLIVVFITAIKFIGAGVQGNPQSRMEAMETIWRWFFAILIIASAPLFVRVLFVLNNALVEAFKSATGMMGIKEFNVLNGNAITSNETGSILGDAIVKMYMLAMEFWINVIFFVRNWVLRVFYIFTPIMAWLWAMNKNVNAVSVWIGEILTNAFLHSAYALVFCVIIVFIQAGNDIPWPAKVIGVASLVALANAIRNTLQGLWSRLSGVDEEGIGAKALGVLGLGGMAGVGRVAAISAAKPGGAGGLSGGSGGTPSGGSGGGSSFHGREAAAGEIFPSLRGQPPPISGGTGGYGGGGMPSGESGGGMPSGKSSGGSAGSLPQAMVAGRATQGAFQTAAAVASAPFNMIPGGQHVQRAIVGAAGATGRVVGGSASMYAQSIGHARQESRANNEGFIGTIKRIPSATGAIMQEATGEQSTWKAGIKTAGAMTTETMTPGMTEHVLPRMATQQSLDGYRFR
jgi:hypothetical protein